MIGAAPRKANTKPKFKIFEDPEDQQEHSPPAPHVIKLREVSVNIPIDQIRRMR